MSRSKIPEAPKVAQFGYGVGLRAHDGPQGDRATKALTVSAASPGHGGLRGTKRLQVKEWVKSQGSHRSHRDGPVAREQLWGAECTRWRIEVPTGKTWRQLGLVKMNDKDKGCK